jgi:hypothetical protein
LEEGAQPFVVVVGIPAVEQFLVGNMVIRIFLHG